MPNSWTDITAEIDNIAELKVVEYILRHTWGYQEYGIKKHITIDEFVNGRRRHDGSRMDKGTGLSERAVYDGLRKAVENGLIEEEIDDSDRGRVKKFYSLRMREDRPHDEELQSLQSGVQSLHPPLQSLHPGRQSLQARGADIAPRTEKDTQERHLGLSNFEGSHDRVDKADREAKGNVRPIAPSQRTGEARAAQANVRADTMSDRPTGSSQSSRVTPPAGYASLADLVARRRATVHADPGPRRPRRPRSAEELEEREQVVAFLSDFAREFNDQAQLASSVTRAVNLFKQADLPREQWGDYLYQARAITQERTGSIRTTVGEGGNGFSRKNKAPYFFEVLLDLLHLRAEADRANGVEPT